MQISDNFRKLIAQEIDYVVSKMDKANDASRKLYYFSGVQGAVNRVFNLEYDPELIFIHVVLSQTYSAFSQRLQALKQGDDMVPLSEEQFGRLSEFTKELGKRIKANKDTDDVLKKFVLLSYSTTGNGYYLLDKGILKF